jgi:hypothetical protein
MEWIFSGKYPPKKKRISLVPQELPPFFNGSSFPEKTANSERPYPP